MLIWRQHSLKFFVSPHLIFQFAYARYDVLSFRDLFFKRSLRGFIGMLLSLHRQIMAVAMQSIDYSCKNDRPSFHNGFISAQVWCSKRRAWSRVYSRESRQTSASLRNKRDWTQLPRLIQGIIRRVRSLEWHACRGSGLTWLHQQTNVSSGRSALRRDLPLQCCWLQIQFLISWNTLTSLYFCMQLEYPTSSQWVRSASRND